MVKRYTWLSLLVIGLFSGNKAFAQFPYFNSFKTSDQTGVTLGGTAKLTSGVSDPVDDGVLRLTSSSTNQRGYGYIDSSFPFNKGIKVEFEYFTYGGLKADGITFFLFDPSSGFEMGQFGGALGYAQNDNSVSGQGMKGGFLAIGLDEYGNFGVESEKKNGGILKSDNTPFKSELKDADGNIVNGIIAVRGGVGPNGERFGPSAYPFIGGKITNDVKYLPSLTPLDSQVLPIDSRFGISTNQRATNENQAEYRKVRLDIQKLTGSNTGFLINVDVFVGEKKRWITVLENVPYLIDDSRIPKYLKGGFSGSTGYYYNNHEVRNVSITPSLYALMKPKANNDVALTRENKTLSNIDILANDNKDANGPLAIFQKGTLDLDTTTAAVETSKTIVGKGTFSVDVNGLVTFVPAQGYVGDVAIGYSFRDNYGVTSIGATLTVTVKPNTPPTVADISKSGPEDQIITFAATDFTSKYTDSESDPLVKVKIGSLPPNGVLKLNTSNITIGQEILLADLGKITFVPNLNWNGSTSFFWNASDGGNYAPGNVLVTIDITAVNDAPTVANITKSGTEDTPLPFSESDFDAKFTDPDGESLYQVKFKSLPANGTLKLNGVNVAVGDFTKKSAMANLVFIPNANWNGTTSFTWNGSDLSSTYAAADATVNITINAVNDAPVAYRIYKTGTEDTQLAFSATDFTSKFSDVDGNSMTKAKIVSLTANGTLKLNGVDILAGQEILTADLSKVTFTPNANWNGVTTFDWNGHDGTSYAVKDSLVQITIGGINDIPTVADFSKVGPEDTPIEFAATDFSTKFSDIDNNVLNKIKIVSLPANGALKLAGATIATGQEIAAANLANITFMPTADWNGNTSFLWNGSDGSAYAVSNATVSIKIDAVNDLPIVSYNKVSGIEDMPIAFDPIHFKNSFTDADGDVLVRIKIASLPLNGILRFNGVTATIGEEITTADISKLTFEPSLNWNGNTSFLWNGSDGTAYANSHKGANGILVSSPNAQMSIAISPVDDPAIINSVAKSGPEDVAIPFTSADFVSKFVDADGPLVKIKVYSLSANGTLMFRSVPVATGAEILVSDLANLSFVPNPNWNGTTGFKWDGFDGANYTALGASVIITISPLQDVPKLESITKSGTEDTPLAFSAWDFTSKFNDTDNEALTKVKVLTLPTDGLLKLNGVNVTAGQEILVVELNNLSFTPNINWNGFTAFNWNASDGTDYALNYVEARITINPVDDPAVLTDIVKSGNEDAIITFTDADFRANFADPDGGLTKIKILTLPANGALKLDGALVALGDEISAKLLDKITFTPKADWNGSTSFGWNGSIDVLYDTPGANVLITVSPLSDKPVISDFTKNGIEDTPLVFAASDFTIRFTDADGDALTKIVVNTLPANGILKLNGVAVTQDQSIDALNLGNLTFVPDANWHDHTSFEWEAFDGTEYSTTKAKVNILIDGVDDPSTLTPFTKNGQEDTPVPFIAADFTSNFSDVDGGLRVVKIISLPLNGTLKLGVTNITAGQEVSLAELPNISFVPSVNWNGSTSFSWNATQGGASSSYAGVDANTDIIISPVNDAPLLTSFPKSGQEDSPVAFTPTDFTSHFRDVDRDALRYIKIISVPSNGTLKLNGIAVAAGQEVFPSDQSFLNFDPDANWHGTTTFKWNAFDGTAYAVTDAEVNIKIDPIDDPATVSDFTKSGQEDTTLPFTVAGFTSRFNDVDGPLVDVKIISVPLNGKLKLNGVDIVSGQVISTASLANITFVPDPNWNGTTSFQWNATDGTAYAAIDATATINISSINDAPVVSDFSKSGPEDVTLAFQLSDFTSHFSDADGGQLTEIRIESLPANGTLKLTGSSAYNLSVGTEINAADLANLVFVPNANWNGITKFKWKGFDLDWSLADAEVTVNITTVDDPAAVVGFTKSGPEDATISFLASDFTTKFSDADGALAKVKVTSLPANGKLKLSSTNVTIGQEIVLADLANITFVPDVNWNGSTNFTWNATEGTNYAAVDARVDITINGVNDLPSVRNFFKSGTEDAILIFTSSDFTTRFTDTDNDLLTAVKIVSLPADGKLKLNGVNIASGQTIPEASLANITFVPDANWNGTTVFNWNAIDGTVYALTDATVTITISAQPDAPVISDINKTGKKNKPITFSDADFTSQFIDLDNDALNKIKITNLPADGTLKLDGTATLINQEILFADLSKLSFEPSLDWFGSTSFDWEATDGALYSSGAKVNIKVNDVLPPTAVHDNKVVNANMPEAINVLQNDVEGDLSINPSSVEVISKPLNGQAKENADGTITYSPKNNFIGSDSFTYQVKDTDGILSNIATVTIIVAGVQLTNVFTPNGDGKNDTFVIVGLENFDNADLAVYNRWGNEVYRNSNYKNTWDGDGLNDGTYYYILKVKKGSNQETRKGWTLIKRN